MRPKSKSEFLIKFSAGVIASTLVLGTIGCGPAIVGAGATLGVAVAQQRTIGNAIDDAGIQLKINRALLEAEGNLFTKVGVEVVEGRVLLTGAVPTAEHRVEAVRIAWNVEGIKEVLNEIQIAERGGITAYANDVRISSQLRLRIITDRTVSDINYSIDTVNGVIYLMGIAGDQTELDTVIGYARGISGVTQVISHVRLKDDPRRA